MGPSMRFGPGPAFFLAFSLTYTILCTYSVTFPRPHETLSDFTLFNHGDIWRYHGYHNMMLAEYIVPHDVAVGTWMIKIKPSPYGCLPSRNITVVLQPGTIPLVNALNESFPDYFQLQRFETQHRIFVPNTLQSTFLNVTHPKPGPWYLLAFYISNDNSISQKGLYRICFSHLIIGLQFRILSHIPQLSLHSKNDAVPLVEFPPEQDSMLFKFFVPQSVISYQISLSNCTFQEDIASSFIAYSVCPLVISSRAEAPPVSDNTLYNATTYSTSIGYNDFSLEKSCDDNNMVMDLSNQTHCILQNDVPIRGTWHYLNISRTANANATLTFLLQTTSEDCHYMFQYADGMSDILRALDGANSTEVVESSVTTASPKNESNAEKKLFSFCPSFVNDLFKTVKEGRFQYSFYPMTDAIGELNWLGRMPGLYLRNDQISFYSIHLTPVDDIGGTLKILLEFFDSSMLTKTSGSKLQIQYVSVCVTKDFVLLHSEEDECSRGFKFVLDSSKSDKVFRYIPYPEPGKYFFRFHSKCINASTIKNADTTTGQLVDCAPSFLMRHGPMLEGILLKFNITSDACVDSSCGPNGKCLINYYSKVQYSYCSCHERLGYRGYQCTGLGPDAPTYLILLLSLIFLIGSNLGFVIAIIIAIKRRFYLEAVVYCGTFFFSTFYHACDQPYYSYCIFSSKKEETYDLLQYMDFVTALLALWVTVLAAADLPLRVRLPVVISGSILVPALVYFNRFLLQTIVIPLGISFVVLMLSWLWRCYHYRQCFPRRHYSLWHVLPGGLCGFAGIVCFTQSTTTSYYIIHSVWHILMATAIAFLLPCVNKLAYEGEDEDICQRRTTNLDTESTASGGNGTSQPYIPAPYAINPPETVLDVSAPSNASGDGEVDAEAALPSTGHNRNPNKSAPKRLLESMLRREEAE